MGLHMRMPMRTCRLDGVKEPKRNRVIRVQDSLWMKAIKRADEKGESLSEAIRRFLERYVR